jgi:uncharacterized membrane protein YdjX (TVP38/TMEM64 family)
VIALVAGSWAGGGIAYVLLRTDADAAEKLAALRDYFDRFGPWGPLAYFVMVTIEVVVAPIPGLMLYAPGGVLFGAAIGGAVALLGNVVGAVIACMISRSLRPPWIDRIYDGPQRTSIREALERHGGRLIFLLRLNPLTSSDLVSYAAGFTRIPVWQVAAATLAGMAPLCFVQAWLADSLFDAFPRLIYPLLALCGLYAVLIIGVIPFRSGR